MTVVLLLFAYLDMLCTLNLEMSDCWPMLSKFEWFPKRNTAFCSFRATLHRQSVNQSTSCLGTLTVTHADASFSVTIIVLTLRRQRKAPQENEDMNACPWQPFIWRQIATLSAPFKAVLLFCHVTIFSKPPLKELKSETRSLLLLALMTY